MRLNIRFFMKSRTTFARAVSYKLDTGVCVHLIFMLVQNLVYF